MNGMGGREGLLEGTACVGWFERHELAYPSICPWGVDEYSRVVAVAVAEDGVPTLGTIHRLGAREVYISVSVRRYRVTSKIRGASSSPSASRESCMRMGTMVWCGLLGIKGMSATARAPGETDDGVKQIQVRRESRNRAVSLTEQHDGICRTEDGLPHWHWSLATGPRSEKVA